MNPRRGHCPLPCGKARLESVADAKLLCIWYALARDKEFTWYRSKECRCWHISSKKYQGRRSRAIKQFRSTA